MLPQSAAGESFPRLHSNTSRDSSETKTYLWPCRIYKMAASRGSGRSVLWTHDVEPLVEGRFHDDFGDYVKRLLVITPNYPGGVPTQGGLIAQKLHEAGFKISVLSKAKSGAGRCFDIISQGLLLLPQHDVVLVNVYGGRAFIYESFMVLYGRLCRKRVVVYLHSGRLPAFIARWPRWTRGILSLADLRLTPHKFLHQKLTGSGVRVDGVLPNFIELEKYRFKERSIIAPRFLYMRGLHSSYYNPEMALRAFALIQHSYPNALLTMAGQEGDQSVHCRDLVRRLNLRNVHFVGVVPKSAISDLAAQHDIHLHTNRIENMPVSIIEMWACGVPIVGTDVGGMPYLVRNGVDGVLVRSDDFKAMAAVCFRLLSESEYVRNLSRNGRTRAEELTWNHVRPGWESALCLNEALAVKALRRDSSRVEGKFGVLDANEAEKH
jgi:glycosyltransferase involved in cell wall biosynthesis